MYPYITQNNLLYPQDYNYTAFNGTAFLYAYLATRESRLCALGNLKQNAAQERVEVGLESTTSFIIEAQSNEDMLKLVIKTFEINKRLYERYTTGHSRLTGEEILVPDKTSCFTHMDNYLCFAQALSTFFNKTQNLLYLNTLLKLNDTLISLIDSASSKIIIGGGGVIPTSMLANWLKVLKMNSRQWLW